MIPIQISIAGFLSYRDKVELDFTSFDLACIAGRNGSGKSSILDAITWSLFGRARQRNESLINTHPDVKAAEVIFTFAYEGNIYRIQRSNPRGKISILEFYIHQNSENDESITALKKSSALNISKLNNWKPLTERTLRQTQKLIEDTLRLDYETFINASFFLQGKADQFTQQRPGDRKRILGSILGLEIWEVYRRRTVEQRKGIEADVASLDGRLHEINLELAEESQRKDYLKSLNGKLEDAQKNRIFHEKSLERTKIAISVIEDQRKAVQTIERQLEKSCSYLEELQNKFADRREEGKTFTGIIKRENEIDSAYEDWQASRIALEKWNQIAAKFFEHDKRRNEPLAEIRKAETRLEEQAKKLQEEYEEVKIEQAEIPQLKSQLEISNKKLEQVNDQIAHRKELENELKEARQRWNVAEGENPLLKAEMEKLKERIETLKQTEGAVCPLCNGPLEKQDRKNLIDTLTDQGKEMGDKYRLNMSTLGGAEKLVKDLENQISKLADLEDKLRTHTRSIDKYNSRLEQIDVIKKKWEQAGSVQLEKLRGTLEKENYALQAREKLAEIDAELKQIGYDAKSHDDARKDEAEKHVSEEEYRSLEKARAAVAPLEREIADLESQISKRQDEVSKLEGKYNDAAASLSEAEAQAPDLEDEERQLQDVKEVENSLHMEIGAARQKVRVLEDLKTRRKDIEENREILASRVGHHRQLERAFSRDGVPALLIEQALPQIEVKANDILERLSGGTMSVRFVTQATYKDKKRKDLKETLDIKISDSAGVRDYEMFSGGEAFRVNFAIRLALSEILASRAGASLQTLVIDEGFGSQDTQGRQRLIEAINMVRKDFAKILVITHIDELKDAFPTRIEVEKDNHGSTISVV